MKNLLILFLLMSTTAFGMGAQKAANHGVHRMQPKETQDAGASGPTGMSGVPVTYHGGAVTSGSSIYLIFYGDFSNSTTPLILSDLLSMGQSAPYWKILSTYYSTITGPKTPITAGPMLGAVAYDPYSYGKALSQSNVYYIAKKAIQANGWTFNTNNLYFVIGSKDVTMSGQCTQYCGWHTSSYNGNAQLRYAWAGSGLACPSGCIPHQNGAISPNGNIEADGLASIISHEVSEFMSDPDLRSWYDINYSENADKCAWTFGPQYTTPNGGRANMKVGSRDFLIQQNWVNSPDSLGGYCALSY